MPGLYSQKEEYELITALKGRGEVPLKFAYFGKGAERWAKIEASSQDQKKRGLEFYERRLFSAKMEQILNTFGNLGKLNLIDIGCGFGSDVYPVLDYLKKTKKVKKVSYTPIDISEQMLKLAGRNIEKGYNVRVVPNRLDFESGNISEITSKSRRDGYSNLLMFMGSTLGNQSDMTRVLSNFRDSMTSEDYLIVGTELLARHKISTIIKEYYNRRIVYDLVFTPLGYYGVRQKDGKYMVRFNDNLNQVEAYFILNKDIRFNIGKDDVALYKGEEILLFKSTKFSDWGIAKIFSSTGYRIESLMSNPENNYALVLCQPSRFRF